PARDAPHVQGSDRAGAGTLLRPASGGLVLPRRVAGVAGGGGGRAGAHVPGGAAAEDHGDLQAPDAEGQGAVPWARRPRVLAACAGAEHGDGGGRRPPGPSRVLCDGSVRGEEERQAAAVAL